MQKLENCQLGRVSPQEFAEQTKYPVVVLLENVRSAMNVGSFFRTADAFAIERIVLGGYTATPPSKEIRKTALGAEQTVEWLHVDSVASQLILLKEQGYTAIAVEQVEGSVSLNDFAVDANGKYALVFGNEVEGVEQTTVDLCDYAIEIPQQGTKHSLNVSVAGGVVMWHFFKELL
ncbi:MAG: RNA methyltransferase [Rikenellaceae bacterium]